MTWSDRVGPERFENHRRVGGDNRPAFTACSHPNVGHAHSGARAVLPRGRGTHSGQREGRPGGGGDLARPAGACVWVQSSKPPPVFPLRTPSAACAAALGRPNAQLTGRASSTPMCCTLNEMWGSAGARGGMVDCGTLTISHATIPGPRPLRVSEHQHRSPSAARGRLHHQPPGPAVRNHRCVRVCVRALAGLPQPPYAKSM